MIKRHHLLTLSLLSIFLGCSEIPSDSQMKENAKANDTESSIVRVFDVIDTFPVYVTNGKGYKIQCNSTNGIGTIIQGLGLDISLLPFTPAKSISSEEIINLKIDEQPVLSCDSSTTEVYELNSDNTLKYFLSFPDAPTKLYMVGCLGLLDAMGLSTENAKVLPNSLEYIFDKSDANDISCIAGTPIHVKNPRIEWTLTKEETSYLDLTGNEDVALLLNATLIDASGEIEYSLSSIDCSDDASWLSIVDETALVGRVPEGFSGEYCHVEIQATSIDNELTETVKLSFIGKPEVDWDMTEEETSIFGLIGGESIPTNLKAKTSNSDNPMRYEIVKQNCTRQPSQLEIIGSDSLFLVLPKNFITEYCAISVQAFDDVLGIVSEPLAIEFIGEFFALNAPIASGIYTIQQGSSLKFMDAHKSQEKDYDVIVRDAQNNSTQEWLILQVPGSIAYTIQQVSGKRYLDAHQIDDKDYRVVTRKKQKNNTQQWYITAVQGQKSTFRIQQVSSKRFLDAHTSSSRDFSIVTRKFQNNDTQEWILTN